MPARFGPAALLAVVLAGCGNAPDTARSGSPSDYKTVTYVSTDSAKRAERYACPKCRITFEFVADAGFEEHSPGRGSHAVRDAHGNFWIDCTFDDCGVAVFDSAGNFIKPVGRPGAGPGERRWVRAIAAHGRQVYLADSQNHRISIADSTFEIVRSISVPYSIYQMAVLPGGGIAARFDKINTGVPFSVHLLSENGAYVSALGGADSSGFMEEGYLRGDLEIAASQKGSVIVASAAAYVIKEYVHGHLRQTLTDDIDWFDAYASNDRSKWPRLLSVTVDDEDRLWVLISLQVQGYKYNRDLEDSNGFAAIPDVHGGNDSVVEVWDLKSGRLLAGTRIDQAMRGFGDGSHIYTYADAPDGAYALRFWRMTLQKD